MEDSFVDGMFQIYNTSIKILYINHKEEDEIYSNVDENNKSPRNKPIRKQLELPVGQPKELTIFYVDIDKLIFYNETLYIIKNVLFLSF